MIKALILRLAECLTASEEGAMTHTDDVITTHPRAIETHEMSARNVKSHRELLADLGRVRHRLGLPHDVTAIAVAHAHALLADTRGRQGTRRRGPRGSECST